MQSPSLFEVVGDKGTSHQSVYITGKSFGSDPIDRSFRRDTREETYMQKASCSCPESYS